MRAQAFAAFAFFAFAPSALAQAWVAPAGVGTVNFSFQKIDNTGHLLTSGALIPDGKSTDEALYAEAEYAFTDRFSASVGLPFVFAKYVGPGPPPPPVSFLPVDRCFCWHGGWQDAGFSARYNLVNGPFAFTPSVSLGVPSHDYNYRGEAVVGRNLKEVRFGVDAGLRLDVISPKLSVQGRSAYAVVQRELGVPNNRSNSGVEADFQFSRKFSGRWLASWQRTHGGLRFPDDLTTPDLIAQHDRLLRDNSFHMGGGASYSFARLDVFASYLAYVNGTDSHAGHAFTAGVSWPFETGP